MRTKRLIILLVVLGLVASAEVAGATAKLTNFQIVPDKNNFRGTLTLPACTYATAEAVTTAAQTVTVPTGATCVNFSGTGNFDVNFTTTAVVPTADETGGTSAVLNPGCRSVAGIATFSIIAPSACIVTMEWYK